MPDLAMRFGNDMLTLEGAMGTMLMASGADPGIGFELLNILEPELVGGVHHLYRIAGADIAITNTFGGTRARLAAHGLDDRLVEVNQAGVVVAKQYNPEHVLGDIGPCGLYMGALGTSTFDEIFEQYREQAEALMSAQPDGLLVETMIDIADARVAVMACRSVTDLPVIATCSFGEDGTMPLSGTSPEAAAVILEAAGASAVGINCGTGPEQMYPLMQRMAHATALPLIVQPNAGLPTKDARGRTRYSGTPDEAAAYALRFRDLGVQMVGSCCGSTPAFTGAINGAVEHLPVIERASDEGAYIANTRVRVPLPNGGSADLEPFTLDDYADDAVDDLADDILMEAISSEPFCFRPGSSVLLEQALKVYPGRALVEVDALDDEKTRARALATIGRYGAVAYLRADSDDALLERLHDEAVACGLDAVRDIVTSAETAI